MLKIDLLGNELNQLSFYIPNRHLYLRLSCEWLTATRNLPLTHCCTVRFKVMGSPVVLWLCGKPNLLRECNYELLNHHPPANAMRQKAFRDSFPSGVPPLRTSRCDWACFGVSLAWNSRQLSFLSCLCVCYRSMLQGPMRFVFSFLFHFGLWDRCS